MIVCREVTPTSVEPSFISVLCRTMGLTCGRCSRTFNADSRFVDLTLTSGIKKKAFQQKEWFGTELFR